MIALLLLTGGSGAGCGFGISNKHDIMFQRQHVFIPVWGHTTQAAHHSHLCQALADAVQLFHQGQLPLQLVPILVDRHVLVCGLDWLVHLYRPKHAKVVHL